MGHPPINSSIHPDRRVQVCQSVNKRRQDLPLDLFVNVLVAFIVLSYDFAHALPYWLIYYNVYLLRLRFVENLMDFQQARVTQVGPEVNVIEAW